MPTWVASMAKHFDSALETGELKADFSHKHAAVASGIAEFGWNGLALTPEFGSMNRFNTLLTSARLEPTPMYNGPKVCRPDLCDKKCSSVCPADALSRDDYQICTLGDKEFRYGGHHNIRCIYAIMGMIKGSGALTEHKLPDGDVPALTFFHDYMEGNHIHPYDKSTIESCFGIICGDYCGIWRGKTRNILKLAT